MPPLSLLLQAVPVLPPTAAAASAAAASGSTSTLGVIAAALVGLAIGALGTHLIQRLSGASTNGTARWPKDWPAPLFTKDENDPGYMDLSPTQAMNARAQPFGRTYPRLRLFPNVWPLRELRRMVEYATSRPVYIPYKKRFQHVAILGGTGKGKSTSFVIPALAYGAMEPHTAYFAIDVKSPQFLRTFGPLYQKAHKPVYFVDPWTPGETMAFEPVWRATGEKKKIIAEVVSSYSLEPSPPQENGNSEFFKLASNRLMRALLDIAQFWPRQYANLPCIAQLVGGGGNAIKEAFEQLPTLLPDLETQLRPAAEAVLQATTDALRPTGRSPELSEALDVLNRSGPELADLLRTARRAVHGLPSRRKGREAIAPLTGPALDEALATFWTELERTHRRREAEVKKILKAVGEFIQMPEDTRNSVVSTIQNKVEWFADDDIALVFSRDEFDPDFLTQRPCLMLIGAPMSKLQIGSLFVSSIITNLAINSVFQRGQYIENREAGVKVSDHGIFFMLDEFPQLNIKDAHKTLATMRSFLAGLCMIYQDRGQLRQIYGDNVTTVESNTIHRTVLQGVHEDAAEFYATKTLGKVIVKKKTKVGGKDSKEVQEQEQEVPLMAPNDVIYMKLNGKSRPDMALNMTKDFEPFPMKPIPFYEDPVCQKLLGMESKLKREDSQGRPTWKFWLWRRAWSTPKREKKPLLTRRAPLTEADRAAGRPDPIWDRMQDGYSQYLDYIAPDIREGYLPLAIPDLDFGAIGVVANNPDPSAKAAPALGGAFGGFPGGAGAGGFGGFGGAPATSANPFGSAFGGGQGGQTGGFGGAQSPAAAPALPASALVPMYAKDMRQLLNDDFQPSDPLPETPPQGGTFGDRLAAEPYAAFGDSDD